MNNSDIADVFSLLSKLMDIHGEDASISKSYSNASFQIDRLSSQLTDTPREKIASLRGLGDDIAPKIIECIETGTISYLQKLIENTPEGIKELMKIKGIGPKKLSTIWKELQIESPGELLYACNENRLVNYKGFGEKTQQTIKEAIEFYFSNQRRYLYASIEPYAYQLLNEFQLQFPTYEIRLTSHFLRQDEIIDELTFIFNVSSEKIQDKISSLPGMHLENKIDDNLYFTFQSVFSIKILCAEDNFFEQYFYSTCTEQFLEVFQSYFPDIDYSNYSQDEELFEDLDIQFIPPFLRELPEVIEQALNFDLPDIIQTKHIKGVIHNHSTWSDGKNSIEEMAMACIEKGYEYLVISDHSVTSFYAKGLNVDRIKKQHEEIDVLNEKLKPFKIFKSIECDILGDGQLDYSDAVLELFDLVIVSIHQNLNMTEEKAMQRLLRAIEHPCTRILCHPTGRLLLSRKEYPVNFKQLIESCAKHHVVIEINANPRRLDIDWRWIQYAMLKNVRLSINPDAHSIHGIDDIRYGVLVAQKGMLTAKMNLSSYSLLEFETFLKEKT